MADPTPVELRMQEGSLAGYQRYGAYGVALAECPAWLFVALHDTGWIRPTVLARLESWDEAEVDAVIRDLAKSEARIRWLREHRDVLRTLTASAQRVARVIGEDYARQGYLANLLTDRDARSRGGRPTPRAEAE